MSRQVEQTRQITSCEKHMNETLDECLHCRIAELKSELKASDESFKAKTRKEMSIIHCENCGSSWYDDGWTGSCPKCKIAELETQNKTLSEYASNRKILIENMAKRIGIMTMDNEYLVR